MEHTPKPSQENKEEKKTYLYHMVPENMEGNTLHPLNKLKETHPHLYLAHAEKYKNRPEVMNQFIPTLECAWNDVLQFTPVDPHELKAALAEAGLNPKEMKFFQVDPALLDPKNTTVFLYRDRSKDPELSAKHFAKYDPEGLSKYSQFPEATKEYYKESAKQGRRPLMYVGVPHVFHKGSIDISNLPVITV